MTVPELEASITGVVRADVVIVDASEHQLDDERILAISGDHCDALIESDPIVVQPGQLWVLDSANASTPTRSAALAALGAAPISPIPEQRWQDIAEHLSTRLTTSQHRHAAAVREGTVLRRELNRALSALDERHSILGLLPSPAIDEILASRSAQLALRPTDPAALMTDVRSTPEHDSREVEQLRAELEAINRTRLMRWSRAPRRVYGRLRRLRR